MEESSASNSINFSIESTSTGDHSLEFDSKRNLFKWRGSFEALEEFCSKSLGLCDFVVSVSDRSKALKSKSVTVTHFTNTGTLKVQGTDSKKIIDQLASLLNVTNDDLIILTSRHNENDNGDQQETVPWGTSHHSSESKQLADMKAEINKIWKAIRGPSSETNLARENADLRSEISELKETVEFLQKQVEVITDERNSLRVALQIVTRDLSIPTNCNLDSKVSCEVLEASVAEVPSSIGNQDWQTVQKRKRSKGKKNKQSTQAGSVRQKGNTPASKLSKDQKHGVNNKPSTRSKVVVVGDSMISKLEGWKMSNADVKVKIRSFNGCTVGDLKDYIRPTIREAPSGIILNAGTNNLISNSPTEIVDCLVNICTDIEKELPETSLAISELVVRSDNQDLNAKISQVNKSLRAYCKSRNWSVISQVNVDKTCLNSRGLHLNRKGVGILASNFNTYIKSL